MSIEKYLEKMEIRVNHPGPIAVKLKHDIKNRLVNRRKRKEHFYIATSSVSILVLIFAIVLVSNPEWATSVHNNIASVVGVNGRLSEEEIAQQKAEQLQAQLFLDNEGKFLGSRAAESFSSGQSNIRKVTTSPHSAPSYQIMELSQLEEGKPYVIRKVRDENNRTLYIVNEIRTESIPRLPY